MPVFLITITAAAGAAHAVVLSGTTVAALAVVFGIPIASGVVLAGGAASLEGVSRLEKFIARVRERRELDKLMSRLAERGDLDEQKLFELLSLSAAHADSDEFKRHVDAEFEQHEHVPDLAQHDSLPHQRESKEDNDAAIEPQVCVEDADAKGKDESGSGDESDASTRSNDRKGLLKKSKVELAEAIQRKINRLYRADEAARGKVGMFVGAGELTVTLKCKSGAERFHHALRCTLESRFFGASGKMETYKHSRRGADYEDLFIDLNRFTPDKLEGFREEFALNLYPDASSTNARAQLLAKSVNKGNGNAPEASTDTDVDEVSEATSYFGSCA